MDTTTFSSILTYLRLVSGPWRRAETDRVSTWIEGSKKWCLFVSELRSCPDSKSQNGKSWRAWSCSSMLLRMKVWFHWILKGNTWRTPAWWPACIQFTLLCLVKTFGTWWTCFQFKLCKYIARYDSYLFITCKSRLQITFIYIQSLDPCITRC